MKTTRDQLKNIVKECLIEILAEGMGSARQVNESLTRANNPTYGRQQTRMAPVEPPQQSIALKEAIKREAGGNKVMESILADTAKRTLPNMLRSGDASTGMDSNQQVAGTPGAGIPQFNGTPEQVFGEEVASKWADLAFSDPRSRKSQ